MKDTIKMVINHFFIITTSVMSVIGIGNLISGMQDGYSPIFPVKIMIIGATSALPSFLFYFRKEPTRKQFIIRVILHFICILAVVLGEGCFMGWVASVSDAGVIASIVVLVYIIVWVFTMYSNNKAEQGINEALKNYHNDEEE